MVRYRLKIRHRQSFFVDVLAAGRMFETGVQGYALPYPLAGVLPQFANNWMRLPFAFLTTGMAGKQKG
jgi:hypothetical protein